MAEARFRLGGFRAQAPASSHLYNEVRVAVPVINDAVKEAALAHAKRMDPQESCGLVVVVKRKLIYWPANNIASDLTEDFILDPQDIIAAENIGDVVGIVHSHVKHPVDPSPADRASCNAHGIAWYIVQARQDTWFHLEPDTAIPALAGRVWVWGAADCWKLVRDWYRQHGMELKTFSYPPTPEEFEQDPLFEHYWRDAGFVEVPLQTARYGDVLLMNFRGKAANHIGVVVEDGLILHHARGCLSGKEPLTEWMRKCIERTLRLPAFIP